MFDIQCFANALQQYRRERGVTQQELAEKLFVTPQSVSRWERGETMPDIAHLCELAGILSVSVDALLSGRPPEARCLIGIDAGGTKTEFALIDEEGSCLNTVLLDGCNPNACGIEETISVVRRGIDLLHPDGMNVIGVFFGGAGMASGNYADVMRTALQKAYPRLQIGCANDISNVIACSARPDACIAAISGTGCVAFSSWRGRLRRVGGFGYLFEGCGGGYDIGRDAITEALRARDDLAYCGVLTGLVEEKLGGRANEYVQELYRRDVSYIASFAPLVTQAAQQGDPAARAILERSAAYICRLIRAARDGAPGVRHVILSGSLFTKDDLFTGMVTEQLDSDLIVERMSCPPVWGACLQCARMCKLEKLPSLERFLERRSAG